MINQEDKLTEEIIELINSMREDDWWDFKECHHEDKASLLHDIICMANNRANKDSYLIFGVTDITFEIVGVESDPNRRNQQRIVDFLRQIKFAGQTRPRVEVRTIIINEHELDIFIIKNSTDVPYYLVEDYQDKNLKRNGKPIGKKVHAFHIYTRVMDNNTPIDSNADIGEVELLWKKRFGLLQTPLEQVKVLLYRSDEWEEENNRYYHKLYPQYTIAIDWDADQEDCQRKEHPEFYHYVQMKLSAHYGILRLFHYGTQLFSCQVTELDGYRACVPCPEWGFINKYINVEDVVTYKYYLKNSLLYGLLHFLQQKYRKSTGGDADIAIRRLFEVVLLFDDEESVSQFNIYVNAHNELYQSLYKKEKDPKIHADSVDITKIESKRIRDARVLKIMQSTMDNSCTNAFSMAST